MGQRSFRFLPPGVVVPEALAWALRHAFGPASAAGSSFADSGAGRSELEWSRALGLSARLGFRVEASLLARDGGGCAGAALRSDCLLAAAHWLQKRESIRLVSEAAREVEAPVVVLKGAALVGAGYTRPGCREMSDVDVLTSKRDASALVGALERKGYVPRGWREAGHHLRPLFHPRVGRVEVHVSIPGVRTHRARQAVVEDLQQGDLLVPMADLTRLSVPRASVLAAHAVAHGIGQHGLSPHAYPMLRMVADLLDLAGSRSVGALVDDSTAFLGRSVSIREVQAVTSLASSFGAGELPLPGSDAMSILRHLVAAQTDETYRRALRWRTGWKVLARGDWRKLSTALRAEIHPRAAALRVAGTATPRTKS